MKKYALSVAVFGLVSLQGCNESPPIIVESSTPAALTLETAEQRLSYGIAFGLGQRIAQDRVPMDIAAFSAGFSDGASGSKPRMTQEEIDAEMQDYQLKALAEHKAIQAALGEANLAAAAAFLEENRAKEGVVVTASGLQYEVVEAGEGAKPGAEDSVEVHYRGALVDGTEFDSTYDRGQSVTFDVGDVFPGWTEGLRLMSVGSKYKLVIPPKLGYGSGGAGEMIGPNAALILEVELVSIPSQAAEASAQ